MPCSRPGLLNSVAKMSDKPDWTKEQIRGMRKAIATACAHLETCVQWADDSLRRWVGTLIEPDATKLAAIGAEHPRANTLQRRLDEAVAYARHRSWPVRILVVKGRRSGSSLWWAKFSDLELRNNPGMMGLMMADVFKRSDEIFDLQRQLAESDVFPWGGGIVSAGNRLRYANGSEMVKETAMDPKAGRGGGFRLVWLSEAAHFAREGVRDAKTLMTAILGTVPKTPDSVIGAESTGAGCAGWFYDRWLKARWPEDADGKEYWRKWDQSPGGEGDGGESERWIRVFAAWFEIPRNSEPVTADEAAHLMTHLTVKEKELVDRYGVTAPQIQWRRTVIRNDFDGDEKHFGQEYPSSPQEAFISTGTPAFTAESMTILRTRARQSEPAWQHGVLEAIGLDDPIPDVLAGRMRDIPITFRRTPIEEAWFTMLEPPGDDMHYLVSVDPSTLEDVTEGDDALSLTAALWFRKRYEQEDDGKTLGYRHRLVARIMWEVMEQRPPPDLFMYMLTLGCRYYGRPTLVVETNKGELVVNMAKRARLNLYSPVIVQRTEMKTTERLGWTTTEESRHSIISNMQGLVHGVEAERDGERVWEPNVELEDTHLVAEMDTFIRNPKGKFRAAAGRKDDDVLAAAIGLYLINSATRYKTKIRRGLE